MMPIGKHALGEPAESADVVPATRGLVGPGCHQCHTKWASKEDSLLTTAATADGVATVVAADSVAAAVYGVKHTCICICICNCVASNACIAKATSQVLSLIHI